MLFILGLQPSQLNCLCKFISELSMNSEQRKLRNLIIVLFVLLLGLQVALWFSSTGVANLREIKQTLQEQEQENIELLQRNQTLEAEVKDLKEGLASVEERARSELGMIAEEETFFQLITEDKSEPDELADRSRTEQKLRDSNE